MSEPNVPKRKAGIAVEVLGDCDLFRIDLLRLKAMLSDVVHQAGVSSAAVTILLTDDKGISSTNMRFLNHKGPTDVISFDLSDGEGPRVFDITVNAQYAAREALARGHSGESELALYAVHGLLHCLGYDDVTPSKAKRMHRREDEILDSHRYGRTFAGKQD